MFTKKTRKTISLICLILAFAVFSGGIATAQPDLQELESQEPELNTMKISDDLQDVLDGMEDDEIVPVYIWTKDINYEEVESEVKRTTGFDMDSFAAYCDFADELTFDIFEEGIKEQYSKTTENSDAKKAECAALSQNVDSYVTARRN